MVERELILIKMFGCHAVDIGWVIGFLFGCIFPTCSDFIDFKCTGFDLICLIWLISVVRDVVRIFE